MGTLERKTVCTLIKEKKPLIGLYFFRGEVKNNLLYHVVEEFHPGLDFVHILYPSTGKADTLPSALLFRDIQATPKEVKKLTKGHREYSE